MRINVPKNLGIQTIPPAVYRVRCTGYKTRTSQKGNLCINPELTVQTQGPDETVKTIGRKIFDGWTMTEESLPVVNAAYKALTGEDLPAGEYEIDEFVAIITSRILNREALVQVDIGLDQAGVERNNIKRWTKIEG